MNASRYAGGLVGRNVSATISHCFGAGSVTASNSPAGGLLGSSSAGATLASFWDTQTSG